MLDLIIRVFVYALLVQYVIPLIVPGVQSHGGFWTAGLACGLLLFFGDFVARVAAMVAQERKSFLLGAGFVFFGAIFLFAALLQFFSYLAPSLMTVSTWGAACVAGVLVLIGTLLINSAMRLMS